MSVPKSWGEDPSRGRTTEVMRHPAKAGPGALPAQAERPRGFNALLLQPEYPVIEV
jgi:hypothetical protein